jgi:hypothetical protein
MRNTIISTRSFSNAYFQATIDWSCRSAGTLRMMTPGGALAAMQSREILQSFCQRFECVRQILRILHVARCSQKLTMLGQGKGATCIPRFCGIISKLPGLSLSFDVSHTKGVLRLGGVYSTIAQYDQFVGRLWNGSPPKRYAKTGPARVEQTAVQMRNPGVAGV